MPKPKIAIVADWLTTNGGAESVVMSFIRLFPSAPVFTTVAIPEVTHRFPKKTKIYTSFLDRLPEGIKKRHPFLLPFLPRAIESLDLSEYDIVLSSSSFVGKGILTRSDQLHICYCHSPTRYFWGEWQQYLADFPLPRVLKSFFPRKFTRFREWDFFAAQRPDILIANSDFIADGIQKFYRRKADVLFPPVDREEFSLGLEHQKEEWYLGFGRLVPQKKFDLLIEAFLKMPEKKLLIAGKGRNEQKLKNMIGKAKNIEFLGYVPQKKVPEIMGKARALLFPQIEDAGITALEALSAGTPVIAFEKGGVQTSLRNGKTGIFFDRQNPKSLIAALKRFEKSESCFVPKKLSVYAEQFSRVRFEKKIESIVFDEWKKHQQRIGV
jgi:glycosyltransferase involved in cell wall biosynthesis